MPDNTRLSQHDLEILRGLATRLAALAEDPLNLERKQRWYELDAAKPGHPMVLAEFCGVRDRNPPLPASALTCEEAWARGVEQGLRSQLYEFEVLKDDHVIEPCVNLRWRVQTSNFGVEVVQHQGNNEGRMGSRRWDPPIADLDADFDKLHPRTYTVDRDATFAEKRRLESVFDGLLEVRVRGGFWWTLGLTWSAIDLIGLENLMLAMFDNPDGLHRLMGFLRDDALAYARWLEKEGLLCLNNENDYIGSGSLGYTDDLPHDDLGPGQPPRMQDLWVLCESQETVGVGPDQFEEFIFPYQLSLAERFGKCYYGCCEPVNNRWHVLARIPNLARVSVSPWADQKAMAAACAARGIVFSRKPNPTLISTSRFDEEAIRRDLRETLETAGHVPLEIIMKDVHTLNDQPERLPRWVAIAREVTAEVMGAS